MAGSTITLETNGRPIANEQISADIETLEEALCVISEHLKRVESIGHYPAFAGRNMDYAVHFVETGLLWLETAIGGAKQRLLPEGEDSR